MSGRKERIRNGIDRSSKSKARLPESNLNARTDEIRSALDKHGPLHCRAVVPAYAAKDFHNGCYPPWYVAHVDPDMVSDEALARLADSFADEQGYLFHPTDGLSAFIRFLEQEHGYIGLFTYHDGYCRLDGPEADDE